MNLKQSSDLQVEPWQIEVYRDLPEQELFQRLESHRIVLDRDHFLLYVEECDTPEDLVDCLYLEEDPVVREKVFLCVFELWRRLSPYKQSLSVFVDEFDHLIEQYEEGQLNDDEALHAALESCQSILDDYVDEGGEASDGYDLFSSYSCHDLEVFIYEYISHQIDLEHDQYASELLEGFYPYVQNKRWFDLLRARLVCEVDPEEGEVMVDRLLVSLKEVPDLHLLFETLHFLMYQEEIEPFKSAFTHAVNSLETEDDLKELLILAAEYLESMDKDKELHAIQELLHKQDDKDLQAPLALDHPVLHTVQQLMDFSSN